MSRYNPDDPILGYLAIDRKMTLEDQKRPYDGKKACFVPDKKEGFVTADIISSKGDEITVQTESGEVCKSNSWVPSPIDVIHVIHFNISLATY